MKKMTNLYAKAMETPVEKYRIASIKALFSLIVLLFVSSNAWSKKWEWTVNVGVATGKGIAKAEIIKHTLWEESEKNCSSSTLALETTKVTTDNLFATSNSYADSSLPHLRLNRP